MRNTIWASLLVVCVILAAFAAESNFSSSTIQIGMIVSDLEESIDFYKNVVGMSSGGQFDVDADFGKRSGLTDSLPIHVKILKLDSGQEATSLKLMTFGDKAKPQKNEYLHSHTGIQYVTIMVKNLTPCLERIKKHNIQLLGDTPVSYTHLTLPTIYPV